MAPEVENLESLNDRRSFMKLLAAAPLFASIGARSVAETVSKTVTSTFKRNYTDNIYTRYGIQPIINGLGTYTYIGGSLPLPEARKAWEEASHYFADIYELQDAAGAHLAKLSGAEDGMIVNGAAAAISTATAACVAGSDPNNVMKLPDTTGMKNEVITMGGAGAFSDCITLVGAKLVIARTIEELPNAITPQTAMVYVSWQDYEHIASVLKITKPAGVPILVDAADGFSPEKFKQYAKMGVDLYDFSGGKGICGPQASGVLLGRKDLITAAKFNSDPWEGAILRPLKFGKEECIALLAAIDFWMQADMVAINKEWQGRVERIAKLVETVPGVTTSITTPKEANQFPTLSVNWDEQKFGLTVAEAATQLHTGTPRILVGGTTEGESVRGRLGPAAPRPARPGAAPARRRSLFVTSMTVQPGEELIIGNRLRQILEKARKQAATA